MTGELPGNTRRSLLYKFLPNSTFKNIIPVHCIEEVMQNLCTNWYKTLFFYFFKNKLFYGPQIFFKLLTNTRECFRGFARFTWRGAGEGSTESWFGFVTCYWYVGRSLTSLFIASHLPLYRPNRKTETRSSTRRFVPSLGRKAALNIPIFLPCIPQEKSH
jgi:hypothetical protein